MRLFCQNNFYRITHSPQSKAELLKDVERYYLPEASARLVDAYLPEDTATPEELTEIVGHVSVLFLLPAPPYLLSCL